MRNPITVAAIFVGGRPWLPRLAPYIVRLDRLLQRLTGGRVTLVQLAGLPSIVLTVPGRKTGIPRSTPLLCVPLGETFLVAGTNWGGAKPPAWVGNLEAAGLAEIEVPGRRHRRIPVAARRVTGAERASMWQHMLRTWPNYDRYQRRTTREITVFQLTPVE